MADVIVSGAGPAGTFAAIQMARGGARVVLLDRARAFPRHKLCGDTLNPGAVALLRAHGLAAPVEAHGLALTGMLVTGVAGIAIRGCYGDGLVGRAWSRRHLDAHLLEAAAAAGVDVRLGTRVVGPLVDATGRVAGARVSGRDGRSSEARGRWTIAADGRRSPLALGVGLLRHPASPRRWAIGTYAEGVDGLGSFGEMHVRLGGYVGVAPAEGGAANLCLVTADRTGLDDPARRLWAAVHGDPQLRDRVRRARAVAPVVSMGPLAVDARACGVPGLLLAGDAAGFVDPMTGDGLHLALRGGGLVATVLLGDGAGDDAGVVRRLTQARRQTFGGKLRFNRALRSLVGSPMGVRLGAIGARALPGLLQRVIATAGDVPRGVPPERAA